MQAVKNSNGRMMDYTPGSDVAAGTPVYLGGRPNVADTPIASGRKDSVEGPGGPFFSFVKVELAIADGQPVYWDADGDPYGGAAGTGCATTVALGNKPIGAAVGAAASTDGTVLVNLAGGLKTIAWQHTTVTATDTVVTGLAKVISVVVSFETDPADANTYVSAQIGDQAGSPAAGSVIIKTWKQSGTDPTPIAADSFSKKVNVVAVGY